MKKLVLAIAVASTPFVSSVAAAADVDVKVYGRAHVSVDSVDNGANYNEVNLSSRASRLGFKAESKQESYSVFMQIEQEINFASGADGQKSLSSRDTFVGIKSDAWGSIKAGQFDTPFKLARNPANLFGDQVGDLRNIARTGNMRFDERPANTIQYSTPAVNGLQANIAYAMYEGDKATADINQSGLSASVTYKQGALDLAIAYESWAEDANRGERDAIRVALAYKIASSTKIVGIYQTANHETTSAVDADVYGIGAEFGFSSATALKAMYMARTSDAADTDANMLTLGLEHKLDSQARVYVNYAVVDNDSASNLTSWDAARNTSIGNGVNGETATGLALGLRYDF